MRPLDHCDQLREHALVLAVVLANAEKLSRLATDVAADAQVFLTFLLGAPASSTKEDIEEMEQIIRTGDMEERTEVGIDPPRA